MDKTRCIDVISQPLTLPCGLELPNRLVKCPMQETLAELPYFDPPIQKFKELYGMVIVIYKVQAVFDGFLRAMVTG